jgi:hypothetical protein
MSLADIYVYYAVIGMASPSPQLRASGVAILASLVDSAPRVVDGLLPRLEELAAEDRWWQVQAGLVMVAAGILRYVARVGGGEPDRDGGGKDGGGGDGDDEDDDDGGDGDDGAGAGAGAAGGGGAGGRRGGHGRRGPGARAAGLLATVMAADPCTAVSRVFVAHVGGLLDAFPSLGPAFVDAVAALPPDARERLLGVSARGAAAPVGYDVLPLRGPSSRLYELPCVGRALPWAAALGALRRVKEDRNLQRFEQPHLQLILACVLSADAAAASAGGDGGDGSAGGGAGAAGPLPAEFAPVVTSLQTHLFVALCDPDCFHLALALLRHFVLRQPSGLAILADGFLHGTLVMLHAESAGPAPRAALADFLAEVATRGPRAARAVSDLIASWASLHPALFASSPLKAVRDALK